MAGYYKNKVYNKLPISDSLFRNTDNVINQQSNNNINLKQLKKRFISPPLFIIFQQSNHRTEAEPTLLHEGKEINAQAPEEEGGQQNRHAIK